jgi:thioredoxin-related protein
MRLLFTVITGVMIASVVAVSCSAKTPAAKNQNNVKKDTAVSAVSVASTTAPEKTLLFFMNPNGRPCQMQKEVLTGMNEKLAGLAQVTYIQTTEIGDRNKFSQYGIRGLPSLIIVDKNGNEIIRFSPGIQSEETILAALQKKSEDR